MLINNGQRVLLILKDVKRLVNQSESEDFLNVQGFHDACFNCPMLSKQRHSLVCCQSKPTTVISDMSNDTFHNDHLFLPSPAREQTSPETVQEYTAYPERTSSGKECGIV